MPDDNSDVGKTNIRHICENFHSDYSEVKKNLLAELRALQN